MPEIALNPPPFKGEGGGGDEGQKRVGTKWSSLRGEARLRGLERIIYSKTIYMGSARKRVDRNRVAIQSFSRDGQVENNHGLERMKRMDADGG
jgi:hypothetical protein